MKKGMITILWMLFLLLQYRLWAWDDSVINVLRLQRAIEADQADITKLVQRNQNLDTELQLLKNHYQVLEDRARTDLGMIKKGEKFCLVIEPAR